MLINYVHFCGKPCTNTSDHFVFLMSVTVECMGPNTEHNI